MMCASVCDCHSMTEKAPDSLIITRNYIDLSMKVTSNVKTASSCKKSVAYVLPFAVRKITHK